jgi:hypothetical protein
MFHEHRLIEEFMDLQALWRRGARRLQALCTALTTAIVEALPFLTILSTTERRPFSRTTFCCTNQPS